MAKYSVKHTCGHTVTHQIVGTDVHGERDRKRAWLAEQPCLECQRAAERGQASEATAHLPALQGTAKQVSWATVIRADAYSAITALVEQHGAQLTEVQRAALDALWAQDASWWIEERSRGSNAVLWLREADRLIK